MVSYKQESESFLLWMILIFFSGIGDGGRNFRKRQREEDVSYNQKIYEKLCKDSLI